MIQQRYDILRAWSLVDHVVRMEQIPDKADRARLEEAARILDAAIWPEREAAE